MTGNRFVVRLACDEIADGETLLERLAGARDEGARCVILDLRRGSTVKLLAAREFGELTLFPLPVVAACEGVLAGTALALALAADVRAGDAGCGFDPGGLQPHERQRMAAITGRSVGWPPGRITAEEALQAGLVTAVTAGGGALAEALRVAAVIASRGPLATQLGKEAVWRGLGIPFEQALRFETDLTLLLQTTKDRAEGVAAFIEKRNPEFRGE